MYILENLYQEINQTSAPFSACKSVIDLFEDQVAQTPHHIAIIDQDEQLTYEEFNNRANAIAHRLIASNLVLPAIVAIAIARSIDTLAAIFGVLKAGATFLILDLSLPTARVDLILSSAKPSHLLAKNELNPPLFFSGMILYVDKIDLSSMINPSRSVTPYDLAYICYTSGSTGIPKGVPIQHRSLVNRIEWMQKTFPISPSDRLFQKTSLSFDVSVWELFWWAITGASVVLLPPHKEHNPKVMLELIYRHYISVIHFVPSVLHLFLDMLANRQPSYVPPFKWVFSSGETLTPSLVESFYTCFSLSQKTRLINLYGPTEATIDVSFFICLPNIEYKVIPIGKPIQNTRLYVLSDTGHLADIGESGELLIGGVGLSPGYLNNLEATREKFVHFTLIDDEVLYRTGDIVKLNADGEFIFLGRRDNMIKLRGLRIELSEISYYLDKHPAVKISAVLCSTDAIGNQILIAYIVCMPKAKPTRYDLSNHLSKYLPTYMLPSHYHFLSQLPLLPSGKLDKNRLLQEHL